MNSLPTERSQVEAVGLRTAAFPFDHAWTVAAAAEFACVLEASSPKLGNVHPGAAFVDMNYGHFLKSAAAIKPVFERAAELSVGELVLESVRATQAEVGINTNLGTLLLFAPLAKAALVCESRSQLRREVSCVLDRLSPLDSQAVYEAIRIVKPGGIGKQATNDVHGRAPSDLRGAMRQAADIDAVARQYTINFAEMFDRLLPWLDAALHSGANVFTAICEVQLRQLAAEPDGLVIRKCGPEIANEICALAQRIVLEINLDIKAAMSKELDSYLRSDGHRRNPGTSADLIAAMLFAKLLISN